MKWATPAARAPGTRVSPNASMVSASLALSSRNRSAARGFADFLQPGERTLAINRAFAIGVKGLPRHALRIGNPLLVRLGVAAGGVLRLNDRPLGPAQPVIDLRQFGLVLGLDTEMRDAGRSAGTGADREIDPRIVEHPFNVIVFDD